MAKVPNFAPLAFFARSQQDVVITLVCKGFGRGLGGFWDSKWPPNQGLKEVQKRLLKAYTIEVYKTCLFSFSVLLLPQRGYAI